MDWREGTLWVMAVSGSVIIGWDIIVAFFNRVPNDEDTISGITMGASLKFWTLPYAFGILGGHLFMPGVFMRSVTWWGMSIAVGMGISLGVFSLLYGARLAQSRCRVAIRAYGLLNLGLAVGWMFRPQ